MEKKTAKTVRNEPAQAWEMIWNELRRTGIFQGQSGPVERNIRWGENASMAIQRLQEAKLPAADAWEQRRYGRNWLLIWVTALARATRSVTSATAQANGLPGSSAANAANGSGLRSIPATAAASSPSHPTASDRRTNFSPMYAVWSRRCEPRRRVRV